MANNNISELKYSEWNDLDKTGLYKMNSKLSYMVFKRLESLESTEYTRFMQDCKNNRDFFFGVQYTQDELDAQNDRGQYNLIINKLRKLVRSIVGLVTANKPQFSTNPAHEDDEDMWLSKTTNHILDWIWQNSKGDQTYRKTILRGIRDNIGYFHIIYSQDKKVKFVPLSYDDVRVDVRSKDSLFDDANLIEIVRYVEVNYAKSIFGIDTTLTHDRPRDWSELVDEYGNMPNINKLFSSDKQYVNLHETYRKAPYRTDDGDIVTRIFKETIIGIDYIFREILPEEITFWPIIPLYSEDTENPYKYGEVKFMRGLQKFYNKAYSVIIHNAQLMSNPKLVVDENTIPDGDVEAFEDNFSIPGSVSVLRNTASLPNGGITVVGGQPINTAFYALKNDIDREFEEASLPKQLMGFGDSANNYRNISRLDLLENVLDSYKILTGNIDASLTRLGQVCLQYFKAYVKDERVLVITNADKSIERMKINQKRQLNIDDPNSIGQFTEVMLRNGMSELDIKDIIQEAKDDEEKLDAIKYIFNNTNDIFTDVVVMPRSYAPTYQLSKLTLMMELKQLGIVDNEAVLEKIPYEDRKRLISRLSEVRNLQATNEELQKAMQDLEQELSRFKSMFTQQEVEMIKREAQLNQDYITKDMRLKAYLQKVMQKLQTKAILNETEMKAKEFLMALEKESENEDGSTALGLLDLVNQ